jgi:hypothetical protein
LAFVLALKVVPAEFGLSGRSFNVALSPSGVRRDARDYFINSSETAIEAEELAASQLRLLWQL